MTPDPAAPTVAEPVSPPPAAGVAAPAPLSVSERATHGLMWGTVASVVAKFVGFGQLIALAYFLKVEDFGLLTMAATAVSFASVPLRFGLEEILVQRQRRFHLWSGPAFWLSVTASLGTVLLLCAAAPLAAWFYGNWRVVGLVLVMAMAIPVTASMAVPAAYLSSKMQFRTLSFVAILQILVQAGVALPLAALGVGAMSVAIAGLVSAATVTAYVWTRPGLPPIGRPRVRRWRHFVGDSGMLQGSRLATAVASNVDFIVLGRLAGPGPLGVYSYAYNQSLQAMRLIAANVAGVLFPSLSSFDDDGRRHDAFCRGLRLVLPVLMPFCLLQAALADPGFRLLFKPEYWPGIPLFQILSVGCIGVGAGMLYQSCMLSLRRNDLNFYYAAASAIGYAVLVPIGYAAAGVTGVAVAAAATAILSVVLGHFMIARACHRPARHGGWAYVPAAAIALVSGAAACLAVRAVPAEAGHANLWRLVAGSAAFGVAYLAAFRLIAPATFAELYAVANGPLRRRAAAG